MSLQITGPDRERALRTTLVRAEHRAAAIRQPPLRSREQSLRSRWASPRRRSATATGSSTRNGSSPGCPRRRTRSSTGSSTIDAEPWKMVAGGVDRGGIRRSARRLVLRCRPARPDAVRRAAGGRAAAVRLAGCVHGLGPDQPRGPLHFRNLGGIGHALVAVTPRTGTLTTHVKVTKIAQSAGMIIQHFDLERPRRRTAGLSRRHLLRLLPRAGAGRSGRHPRGRAHISRPVDELAGAAASSIPGGRRSPTTDCG